jgi:hypothetical protein
MRWGVTIVVAYAQLHVHFKFNLKVKVPNVGEMNKTTLFSFLFVADGVLP